MPPLTSCSSLNFNEDRLHRCHRLKSTDHKVKLQGRTEAACTDCSAVFRSEHFLEIHRRQEHGLLGSPTVICSYCAKDFPTGQPILSLGSVANLDPGSGSFLTPGSGMEKKSGSGSGMNNPDHISESLETIFWVKYLNSLLRIRDGKKSDPGSWMEKIGSGIRDKHPRSATQLGTIINFLFCIAGLVYALGSSVAVADPDFCPFRIPDPKTAT
jgi:hypothetical protein